MRIRIRFFKVNGTCGKRFVVVIEAFLDKMGVFLGFVGCILLYFIFFQRMYLRFGSFFDLFPFMKKRDKSVHLSGFYG